MENSGNNKAVWIVPAVLVLLAVGYFLFGMDKTSLIGKLPGASESVATVNGAAISKENYEKEVSTMLASYKAQGVDVGNAANLAQIKTQVLESMINDELLVQATAEAGIKADQAEIEKQYQALIEQSGGEEAFKAELVKNNLTEEKLRENISKRIAITAYLVKNVDMSAVTASEAEISQFYDEYAKAQKDAGQAQVPALKDISEQIKQQIISNKQNALVAQFLTDLRAKASIETTPAD